MLLNVNLTNNKKKLKTITKKKKEKGNVGLHGVRPRSKTVERVSQEQVESERKSDEINEEDHEECQSVNDHEQHNSQEHTNR
jgi:hypothetical protein